MSVTKFRLNSGLSDFFLLDLLFRLLLLHDNCKSVLFEIMMLHSDINIQHWWLLLSVTKLRLKSGLSGFFLLVLLFFLLLLHDNCKSVLFEIMMLHSER